MSLAELPWTALFLVNLAGSIAVTIHALLRKRNPVSAAAWIGLAWFAPGTGALLYLALGVNRVERRAKRLHRPPPPAAPAAALISEPAHLAPLDVAMGRITRRPCLGGAMVEALAGGAVAYPRMLAEIEAAEVSIGLTSYIFRADHVGQAFVAALGRACARGVEVRVLIDAVGGGFPISATARRLNAVGVPTARFMKADLPWRTPILNLRSHRKLLVIDGRIGFIGGLNIGAENVPGRSARASQHAEVRDLHFRIEGPVLAQAVTVFAEDWSFTTGEKLAGRRWFPALEDRGPSRARVVTSGPDHELERIKAALMSAIGAADHKIRIMTPYFLPDEPLAMSLALAATRGVDVLIVVPARSDNWLVDWAGVDGLAPLVAAGCRIKRSAPPFDHSKVMTVDGVWCLVGSSNWDQRSLRLNFELDLEVRDVALAGALEARIEDEVGRDVLLRDVLHRSLPQRLRDAAARLLLPYL